MKKILFLSAMLLAGVLVHAVDYPYMSFVSADGTIVSMSVSSLKMTSSNGVLNVTNAETSASFTLTDLTKMYFSTTDESTSTPTKKDCGLAFSAETASAKMGETFTAPTLTNPYSVEVSWSSSDESVATVDASGNVTLVAAGTTVITATFAGNDAYTAGAASYTLTVEKADPVDCGLAFSTTTATAKIGEPFTEPTLTNPYSVEVTWSSSDESVATVDASGNVTLVAAGTTVITATFAGNDDYKAGSASYTLTVEKADPVDCGLAFSTTTASAKMGESFTEPTLTNPYSVEVTWSSSDESVATVDASGNVTLLAAGTTVITATFAGNDDYNAGSASYTLTVEGEDTGINAVGANEGSVEVYSLTGIQMGTFSSAQEARSSLPKGYYVFVEGNRKYKVFVR
ncbi:MAG: Ig-like domain-containing protein [Prevotella sp.]|nr:Ig-like domain-containing protein [Prevotella sp.]